MTGDAKANQAGGVVTDASISTACKNYSKSSSDSTLLPSRLARGSLMYPEMPEMHHPNVAVDLVVERRNLTCDSIVNHDIGDMV